MIQIKVEKEKMESIEEKHWEWFLNYYKKIYKENYCYKVYNSKTKKDDSFKVDDAYLQGILDYILCPKRLKKIVVGKLINTEKEMNDSNENDKEESIIDIIKHILINFPEIFATSIESSVNSFLKSRRDLMGNIKGKDRNSSKEF